MKRIAVCPGSFDPVTNGHVDIISRASRMFDEVVVLVLHNNKKTSGLFTADERVELLRQSLADLQNVRVDYYSGLLADYVKNNDVEAIVKGLRAVSDFENEFQQSLINKRLASEVETLFMVSSSEYMYLSSSIVKEIGSYGGDISPFVPSVVLKKINDKIQTILKR